MHKFLPKIAKSTELLVVVLLRVFLYISASSSNGAIVPVSICGLNDGMIASVRYVAICGAAVVPSAQAIVVASDDYSSSPCWKVFRYGFI